jgi:2-keto-myo-inositol isomerase
LPPFDSQYYPNQKIGAKALVINMPKNSFESGKPYEKEPEQILIDSTAILNCLCELAQKYGIGIGVEVIGSKRSSIRTVRQVNSLFKTVNYPNLGYVLDPYNLFTYDKTLTFDSILEADPTRIFAAHINQSEEDLPIHLLCKENRSLCDRGVMNIDRYMKNLQTIGYDGPVSIEVFPKDYWEDDAEWIVSECYKTTKAFMEKNGFIDTVC